MTLTNEGGSLPARGFCDICDKDRVLSRCEVHSENYGACYMCHLKEFHISSLETT